MSRTFKEANQVTNEMYKQLSQIGKDLVSKTSEELDKTIKQLENNIENIQDSDLKKYLLKLSVQIYALGDKVEHADFKRDCANAILKETIATEFNSASGAVAAKQNTALLNTSQEMAVNLLYNLVADNLKTKLQLAQKVLDSIKSVMISRNAEQKIQNQLGYGVDYENN